MEEAFQLLEEAGALRETSRIEAATKYFKAIYLMKGQLNTLNPEKQTLVRENIQHFEEVARELMENESSDIPDDSSLPVAIAEPVSPVSINDSISAITLSSPKKLHRDEIAGRAHCKLANALDLDEAGEVHGAISAYMEAAELLLQANKIDRSDALFQYLEQTLDRIEFLKGNVSTSSRTRKEGPVRTENVGSYFNSHRLSKQEIEVLVKSSLMTAGTFLPWNENDACEINNDTSNVLYTDPDGVLPLSSQQKPKFYKWARPHEITKIRLQHGYTREIQKICTVQQVSPYRIRQQYITDCSFVASLCICAAYERRFRKRLITSILYPQNEDGKPILSKNGRYVVKLWLNGVARKVVVDDRLPIDQYGNLLCSESSLCTESVFELWVCLIEKAYMKLCGGYNFPGSNSGVDLFALTGWIPERIFFPQNSSSVKDFETPVERVWERIVSANSFGDCLITVSVHVNMSEREADEIGLVLGHAYAVLAVVKVHGQRLLKLKNPWARKSWKGKFSNSDAASWSDPSFCAALGGTGPDVDNGVFWIGWEDVIRYFQNFQLSWNPDLFKYRRVIHGCWPKVQGPKDDSFNVGDNPQYTLTVSKSAISNNAPLWVLITRHVSNQEQRGFASSDFLTVHLHRGNKERERIWFPGSNGNCVVTGTYTNNPHSLLRYEFSTDTDQYLVLVLSQHKKCNDISYTLNILSTEHFEMDVPRELPPFHYSFRSVFSSRSGPIGTDKFLFNPSYCIRLKESTDFQAKLLVPTSIAVNLVLLCVREFGHGPENAYGNAIVDTGKYRHGFLVSCRQSVAAGNYLLVASPFQSPLESIDFFLDVYASSSIEIRALET